jgi:hypothetical protein
MLIQFSRYYRLILGKELSALCSLSIALVAEQKREASKPIRERLWAAKRLLFA